MKKKVIKNKNKQQQKEAINTKVAEACLKPSQRAEKELGADARYSGLNASCPVLIKHIFRGIVTHCPAPETLHPSFKMKIN